MNKYIEAFQRYNVKIEAGIAEEAATTPSVLYDECPQKNVRMII